MAAVTGNLVAEKACYIHPLGNRVLIIPIQTASEIGGIIVPKNVKDARDGSTTEGTVIDVGPDVERVIRVNDDGNEVEETRLKPGDRVVFSRYTGLEIPFMDGTKFLLIPDGDIQGILDPKCPVLGEKDKPEFTPR
jgi:co-chaperonin GroES (HSP10)